MLRNKLLSLAFILILSISCFAEYVPGQLIVKFRPNVVQTFSANSNIMQISSSSVDSLNKKFKVKKFKQLFGEQKHKVKKRDSQITNLPDISGIYMIEISTEVDAMQVASEYAKDPSVVYAVPNYIRNISQTPNDPFYIENTESSSNEWGLFKIGLTPKESGRSGWNLTTGSSEVIVAVIDTGVNYNHEDLTGRVVQALGHDFVSPESTDPMDDHGHGTHVAGIIGASANNSKGVVGVDWNCKIIPIKAFDLSGQGDDSTIIPAIKWAVDNVTADVISMSFGGYGESPGLEDIIAYAASADCVLVAAAGNDSTNAKSYPAAYAGVIAVAATDPDDYKAFYSNYGDWVDVSAPGGAADFYHTSRNILSTYPFDRFGNPSNILYAFMAGTSMATPFVAGLAALVRAKYPTLEATEIGLRITRYSDNIDSINPSFAGSIGAGRIDAYATLGGTVAKINSPVNGSDVFRKVFITGKATGEGFTNYTVEYGHGGSPTEWITIEESSIGKAQTVLATLDTTGMDGFLTIRAFPNNIVSFESRVVVHAGSRDMPLLSRIAYGPNPFSPSNGPITIQYALTRNSDISLYFFNIKGELISRKRFQSGQNGGNQGDNTVYWDGVSDFSEKLPNGVYLMKVESDNRVIGTGKIIILKD